MTRCHRRGHIYRVTGPPPRRCKVHRLRGAMDCDCAVLENQITLAETLSSETVIVVPMNCLPSYGYLVSAWYKQPVYDTAEKRVGTVADMLFSADGSIDAVMPASRSCAGHRSSPFHFLRAPRAAGPRLRYAR